MRTVIPDDKRFSQKNCASDYHGKSNDWNVHPPELQFTYSDSLFPQHTSPRDTGQRCTHQYAECAEIYTKRETID